MTKIFLILICLFVSFEVNSDDQKIYDKYGKYKGKITNEGRIYSPFGKFLGKIESSRKIYNPM